MFLPVHSDCTVNGVERCGNECVCDGQRLRPASQLEEGSVHVTAL